MAGDPTADDPTAHSWEYVGGQAWESVAEDADGNLIGGSSADPTAAATEAVRRRRRHRARYDAAGGRRVVRDMIRYLYLLVDMSRSMGEKDPALPPGTRLSCTVGLATEFVHKFFDENPISHLGIVILKDGEAEMLTQLSGNPKVHVRALTTAAAAAGTAAAGDFSLQNGLEVAGRSLGHMPQYGSREIAVLCGALSTCDPGDLIVETLPRLKHANIRVSCISLVAEIYVCRRLAEETNGTTNVCLNRDHYRELFMAQCTPPPALPHHHHDRTTQHQECDFVQMGFPTKESSSVLSLVHVNKDKKLFARTGYLCPRCKAKAYELPTDCAVCGLKLVLSPHLARSFHHLFPVPAFTEMPPEDEEGGEGASGQEVSSAIPVPSTKKQRKCGPSDVDSALLVSSEDCGKSCYACLKYVGPTTDPSLQREGGTRSPKKAGRKRRAQLSTVVSDETTVHLRFQCPDCANIFCADCDAYLHETLHNCPGCLCKG